MHPPVSETLHEAASLGVQQGDAHLGHVPMHGREASALLSTIVTIPRSSDTSGPDQEPTSDGKPGDLLLYSSASLGPTEHLIPFLVGPRHSNPRNSLTHQLSHAKPVQYRSHGALASS